LEFYVDSKNKSREITEWLLLAFILASIHTIVSIKSIPQTLRGIELVSVHEKMPKDVNKVFVGH
jgi:hypothetical protein